VSAAIRRDHIVDLVVGNRRPCAVHFNFVVVANHATLGRPTVHQIAERTLAIVSFEFRVEALMPFIVAHPIVSFITGLSGYTTDLEGKRAEVQGIGPKRCADRRPLQHGQPRSPSAVERAANSGTKTGAHAAAAGHTKGREYRACIR
jgi:hypothetical protein